MVRITKENEEIDKSREIEKIKTQAKQEVQNLEEIKNTRISELEKELARLKLLYENKQKEKDKELELTNEIKQMEQKLNEDLNEDIEVNEIDGNENDQQSEISDISETYTEILEQINKPKKLEINTGDMNRPVRQE